MKFGWNQYLSQKLGSYFITNFLFNSPISKYKIDFFYYKIFFCTLHRNKINSQAHRAIIFSNFLFQMSSSEKLTSVLRRKKFQSKKALIFFYTPNSMSCYIYKENWLDFIFSKCNIPNNPLKRMQVITLIRLGISISKGFKNVDRYIEGNILKNNKFMFIFFLSICFHY